MRNYFENGIHLLFTLAVLILCGLSLIFSMSEIKGRVQTVDGLTVIIIIEGGEAQVGDKVRIGDEVDGVGFVPVPGTWKVIEIDGNVVTAQTNDDIAGTPLPGYSATIHPVTDVGSTILPGRIGKKSPVSKYPSADTQPIQKKSPPAEVSSGQVKSPPSKGVTDRPSGGGGTGTFRRPHSGLEQIILLVFSLGIVALALSILWLVRRSGKSPVKIRASLDIKYSDGGRKTFFIREAKTTIGRDSDNSLVLHDPHVSSLHAEILVSDQSFVLTDQGSVNGTFLNGRKISNAQLCAGDEIRIGDTMLVLKG